VDDVDRDASLPCSKFQIGVSGSAKWIANDEESDVDCFSSFKNSISFLFVVGFISREKKVRKFILKEGGILIYL
jgi:hypothetical protein